MRNAALSLAVVVLFSPSAAAQAPLEDPLELLKKVAANYAALPKTSYDFEQVEVRESLGTFHNVTEQRQRIAGAGGKYRQEALPSGAVYIFDGQFTWVYNRDRNEYTKTRARSGEGRAPGLSMFETVGYRANSARFVSRETLNLTSGPVACQVIEVARDSADDRMQYSPVTYWIDAGRKLVLKMNYRVTSKDAGRQTPSETITTLSVSKANVGEAVEESLFHFTPVADAVEVERLTFGPKSPLVGKDAADFELKGVDGQTITRATLRGKMVLLQFSANAEDDSRLLLEMTYRALRGNGLTAIYILPPVLPPHNQPDTGSQMYTVPVATDPGGSAAKKFGIAYTGTVLIDRLGKIVYADTSSRNSLELGKALQKAGVW